jgi:hypothetical protein
LPYYLALLRQTSCILKYNPLAKPLFDRITIVRIYQQSGQWDSYIWAITPLFLSYSSTSLITPSFPTTNLPVTFFFFFTHTFCTVSNKKFKTKYGTDNRTLWNVRNTRFFSPRL